MCAERERERQSASRERRTGEDGVRGKQARAQERESKRDRTAQGCREREKKNALQSNGRLFDALPLVVVWVLVGDGDDVLFSSLLFFLSRIAFRLSFSFALHATSGLSSHPTLPILLTATTRFFSLFFFFLCKKTNDSDTHTM